MRSLLILAAAVWTATVGALAAGERAVVVELFTSQGCSSCPPADALLAQLAGRDDVIPLGLHVDYWDYIGWKDRFAQPSNTARQKGYARTGNWRIYTPQMVIGGEHAVVGSRAMKVADLIRKEAQKPAKVDLHIERNGDSLRVEARPLHGGGVPCQIHIVRYKPSETVPINAGENAGRQVTYSHIVRGWDKAGTWDGRSVLVAEFPVTGTDPIVVILQEDRYGPIVAAARLR